MNEQQVIEKIDDVVKRRHLSEETKKTYLPRIIQYIRFCRSNPALPTEEKIIAFLTNMAKAGRVSASTQNIAKNAIAFLYRDILQQELGDFSNYLTAKKPSTLPVVFSQREALAVIDHLQRPYRLMASLLYGCGLRRNECCSLRIKDIDFDRNMIFVRFGKGAKDRALSMPQSIKADLMNQVEESKSIHARDRAAGHGRTYLPNALAVKFPNAATEIAWQWVFPARKTHIHKETRETRRWHIHDTALQKAVKTAIRFARIDKKASCHTFRHSYATHLLESGVNVREVQDRMGHRSIKTTMRYLHVMSNANTTPSPLDIAISQQAQPQRDTNPHRLFASN